MVQQTRPVDAPRALWMTVLVEVMGVSLPLALQAWEALVQFPASQPLRYALSYTMRRRTASPAVRSQALDRLFDGPMAPAAMVQLLEGLVARQALSRAEATVIEDRLFALTTARGQWQ